MRKNLCRHTYSDTAGACNGDYRHFCLKDHRFLVSSVIGIYIFRNLRRVQYFLCKGLKTALNVSGGGSTVSCKDVSIVTLALNKESVILNIDQSSVD